MPIYEFHCENCKLIFEKIYNRIEQKSQEICPECNSLANKIISKVNFTFAESKNIPKEIDHKVGADAEKRWLDYEERKNIKEKIRKETNSTMLSRDDSGEYSPLHVTVGNQKVSEKEGLSLRDQALKDYSTLPKPKDE